MRNAFPFSLALFCLLSFAPAFAGAATAFEVSGWLPYWRGATTTNDVLPHLSEMTEINPFVYSLKSDGSLLDNAPLSDPEWQQLIAAAKAQHVRVVPTIMTSNTDLIHSLLSNSASRVALETRIANFVKANGFDGIEIDFEGKMASDKDYFSTFLKGLYQRMGQKLVECDIEARTPVDARYYGSDIPPDAEIYANDFAQINKYCDRVKLMTYDQQGVDQQLAATAASSSRLYAPVADPAWVAKVVALTAQSIRKSKIEIGIPTYGYEYDVTAYANDQYLYNILWTFNPGYATQIEQQYGIQPTRAPWGEEELTYTPAALTGTTTTPVSSVQQPSQGGLIAASAAALYATAYNSHLDFRYLVWPDSQSIANKIELAHSLGVRGVAVFKLDGGEDPAIWTTLAGEAGAPTAGGTNPGGSSALTRSLGFGSSGADVRALQQLLNADPSTQVAASGVGSPGHETATFGPATEAAVKTFQLKYGIAKAGDSGFGYVGPATRAKLNSLR